MYWLEQPSSLKILTSLLNGKKTTAKKRKKKYLAHRTETE